MFRIMTLLCEQIWQSHFLLKTTIFLRLFFWQNIHPFLSVLRGHEDVDDGVGAGAEIDQDVAQQEPEVVRGVSDNLMVSWC